MNREGNLTTLEDIIALENAPGLESLQRDIHSKMKLIHNCSIGALELAWRRGEHTGHDNGIDACIKAIEDCAHEVDNMEHIKTLRSLHR